MSATLLHIGKVEHFRALGETGQPVYHSALQLRKVISRRLPSKERHLAIPQRDQQGEGIDWYSDIAGDVVSWSSATEDERKDARTQLETFQQEINALHHSPVESQSGDHEVFTRLVKWVCHFPDENFVYIVGGTPVITFWGFIHPEANRHTNPMLCLYPPTTPDAAQPPASTSTPIAPLKPSPETPEPRVASETLARPWWRRWWWLLPLLLALLLGLLIFGLRACFSPTAPRLGTPSFETPSLDASVPDASFPQSLWQGWNFWPFNHRDNGSVSEPVLMAPHLDAPGLNGGPTLPAIGSPSIDGPSIDGPSLAPGAPEQPAITEPDATAAPDLQAQPDSGTGPAADIPGQGNIPPTPALPNGITPPEIPAAAKGQTQPSLEPLKLPQGAPDGAASFLNGNWRGAGVMDSQTGRPLQVTYAFDQGEGTVYIQRGGSAGTTCAGPVSAIMQDGQLQVETQATAPCEDGSHYEMPRVQCHQDASGIASCAASYDQESFPMQLRKDS